MEYNIYYNPEAFGMKTVGELEDPRASYDFDTTVVFARNGDGTLFWCNDSGCSCPTPFENESIETLTEITDESWDAFVEATSGRKDWGYEEAPFYDAADAADLQAKVSGMLRRT